MAQVCVNGTTLDDSNYSSPMPLIGLYIAATTLVCFVLMLYDICVGLHQRKTWVPCRFFSLNSLTLTLLGVAAKLPVDLTTPMPSAQDQLSKLTGTTIICVCMAFFMPSLGAMSRPECVSNLAALTILVVTVIVNICIQMRTGVIFSLVVEHIIILCIMFLLLVWLWFSTFEIFADKDETIYHIRNLLGRKREATMFQRLKLCHTYSYSQNPQLGICLIPHFGTVVMLSILCTVVLSEALLRSLIYKDVKFCGGDSDYKWSLWMVVMFQTATVILGFLGNFVRWFCLVGHLKYDRCLHIFYHRDLIIKSKFTGLTKLLFMQLSSAVLVGLSVINKLAELTSTVLLQVKWAMYRFGIFSYEHGDALAIHELQVRLFQEGIMTEDWTLRKSVEDIERWMKIVNRNSVTHLIELLSKTPPSPESFSIYIKRIHGDYFDLSCFSIAVLVSVSTNHVSPAISQSLVNAFQEAFEIIYFIDKKCRDFPDKKTKLLLAKEFWKAVVLNKKSGDAPPRMDGAWEHEDVLGCGNGSIEFLRKDPSKLIPQLFVDMLHCFLIELPRAIYKDIVESPLEDLEVKLKRAIGFLCNLEPVENEIQWEFPVETDISSLITNHVRKVVDSSNILFPAHSMQEGITSTVGSPNEIEEVI